MNKFIFGKDIAFKFYPRESEEALSLPSQNPYIYLFDELPTRDHAADGTGAIASINSWTQNASSPYDCTISITAIDDPDSTGPDYYQTYYLGINFLTKAAGELQTIVKAFNVHRPEGATELPGTTIDDLKSFLPALESYETDAELNDHLSMAEIIFKLDLKAKGLTYERIHNLSDAKLCLAFKALELANMSLMEDQQDRFHTRSLYFEHLYKQMMASLSLAVDTDGDGVAESTQTPKPAYILSRK